MSDGPSRPRAPLIELRRVEKTYPAGAVAVRSLEPVTFDIGAGEFVALVGPSGCGKSTLLKLIAGLLPVSAGLVRVGGAPVDGPQDGVGIVFQSPVLLAWRRVLDNVLLPVEIRGLPRARYEARARDLLAMAGLTGVERLYPWQLSDGMQQRAAICRALVHDPGVLLMDEPFGALDALTRERLNLDLQRIWSETRQTVLLITHSIAEAVLLADRVVVMTGRPGRVAAIHEVGLPRPRALETMGDPAFVAMTQTIRGQLHAAGD